MPAVAEEAALAEAEGTSTSAMEEIN